MQAELWARTYAAVMGVEVAPSTLEDGCWAYEDPNKGGIAYNRKHGFPDGFGFRLIPPLDANAIFGEDGLLAKLQADGWKVTGGSTDAGGAKNFDTGEMEPFEAGWVIRIVDRWEQPTVEAQGFAPTAHEACAEAIAAALKIEVTV